MISGSWFRPVTVRDRLRALIEDLLPWYDAAQESIRNARTEAIRQRSIASRIRSERVIAEYRAATALASRAGERVVAEARRQGNER
jgi:hypothetical protein